jgi:hypothetical protein
LHHRTTGVPGQGVDCRLLCPVINLPGPAPQFGVVFAIKLWLRHNVLDNANAWVFRTTVSPTRQAVRHGLFVGGFESLIIPFDCKECRAATKWSSGGPTLRLRIGLENVDDLKADLERGFAELTAA